MRVELNDKATTRALSASGPLGKSANDLTNILWENLEILEITEIVTMQFTRTEPNGRVRRRVVKKISTTKWANNY